MIQKQIGILLFDQVEVLDFCGPFEVFSVTRLNELSRRTEASPFNVSLVAQKPGLISASGGLRVASDCLLADCPKLDLLLVPGGWGTRAEVDNQNLLEWIRNRASEVEILSSVCTGAVMLGAAGLLDGRRATTHWQALGWFRERCPNVDVVDNQHVVQDGRIFTSAGISAGIDMALKLVEFYFGAEIARNTARQMEYHFDSDNRRRIAI